MSTVPRPSFLKPGLDTLFHIDFDWWKDQDNNWRVFLFNYLCPEHQQLFEGAADSIMVDRVDPETAQVTQVDGLQSVLMDHCARQESFLTENTTLVDSVFRLFLARGNVPCSIREIAVVLDRPAMTILRTLSSGTIYRGIRPAQA